MFDIKTTHVHNLYSSEAQIFICFALWFNFEERAPKLQTGQLDMFKVKVSMCIHVRHDTPDALIYVAVWVAFVSWSNFEKWIETR